MRFPVVSLCLLAILSAPARAQEQEIVWEVDGSMSADRFGLFLRGGGDIDGDAVQDLFVSTNLLDAAGIPVFSIQILSGSDGALLRTHLGSVQQYLGVPAGFLGDVDGDNVDDYALVNIDESHQPLREARIYSGASGSVIRTIALEFIGQWNPQFELLDDVDGDGIREFAVGDGNLGFGQMEIVSPGAGMVLHRVVVQEPAFGASLCSLPDQDGDGIDDLAVGCQNFSSFNPGRVRIYSSATGALLHEILGVIGDSFGFHLERLADISGDSKDELVVSAASEDGAVPGAGVVHILSGADVSELLRIEGDRINAAFGYDVADVGDVNGDGVHDLGILDLGNDPDHLFTPFLHSGRNGLRLDRFDPPDGCYIADFDSAGDVDQDGLEDFAFSEVNMPDNPIPPGRVRMVRGNDLYLLAEPREPVEGDMLRLTAAEGDVSQFALTALIDVNGSPVFLAIGGIGSFGASGSYVVEVVVPPGLSGNSFTFMSFAQTGAGGVRASVGEVVVVQ